MNIYILKSNPIPMNINGKVSDTPFHPKDFQTDMDGKRLKFAMVTPQDQFVSEVFNIQMGRDMYPFTITRQEKFTWT